MDHQDIAFAIESLNSLTATERIDLMYEMLEKKKNQRYEAKDYKAAPIFSGGESVLVCSQFFYYATIQTVSEEMCPYLQKTVPCYKVLHKGWTAMPEERKWVMEYDLVGLTRHFGPHEHLAAHWWNVSKLKTEKKLSATAKVGLFSLAESDILRLEEEIKRSSDFTVVPGTENWTMQKWMGMDD